MTRKQLTQFDMGRIVGLSEGGVSQAEIARKMHRSHRTVAAVLKKYV
jgi:IS30 family transposase